jgi:uncharacterized protein YxjI
VFHRTQYVVEKKLLTVRKTYSVKDVNGNLLGYIKGNKKKIWFERMDGTHQGEIRYKNSTGPYEVYDAQDQLRATIEWAGGLGLRRSKWRMKDPQCKQLSMAERRRLLRHNYRILALDGSAIAQIRRKLRSYRIDISRSGFDPLLILSYVVVDISQEVPTVTMPPP